MNTIRKQAHGRLAQALHDGELREVLAALAYIKDFGRINSHFDKYREADEAWQLLMELGGTIDKIAALRDSLGDSESQFGVCPECGRTDGYLNIGRDHWFSCFAHRVKWLAGSNLFSDWQKQDQSVWDQNAAQLADHSIVTPIYWEGGAK